MLIWGRKTNAAELTCDILMLKIQNRATFQEKAVSDVYAPGGVGWGRSGVAIHQLRTGFKST